MINCVSVLKALRRAKELMDRATSQANRTVEISFLIDDIRNKLQDLQNSSRHSMDNSQAASAMNTRIRQLMKSVTVSLSSLHCVNPVACTMWVSRIGLSKNFEIQQV